MKPLIILICALLTGCASFYTEVMPLKSDNVTVTLENNVNFDDRAVKGSASWYWHDGVLYCHIRLRRYPDFLGHEMRHCFEGYWHGSEANGESY